MVENIDYLRRLIIPRGIYMPSRGSPGRADQVSNASNSDDEDSSPITPQNLTPPANPAVISPGSPWHDDPPAWYNPSYLPSVSPSSVPSRHSSRPSTSSSKSFEHPESEKRSTKFLFNFASSDERQSYSGRYAPLTAEDARVLRLFDLRL